MAKRLRSKLLKKPTAPGVFNVPQMRLHKGSGQGYVDFHGRSHYLGL